MSPENNKSPDKDSFIVAFGIYGAVGFQLAFAVVGGLYLGYLADSYFESMPWLTIVGLLIGSAAGFYNLIRIMNWQERRKSKGKEEKS